MINKKKVALQPTKQSVEANKRLAELNALRIDTKTKIPPVKKALSVYGVCILEKEDLVAIKAKQKAGKTTALKTMVAAWLKGKMFHLESDLKEPKILWIDTEQKVSDVKKIIDDIQQMTGLDNHYIDSHLKVYTVRKLSYKTLMDDLRLLVEKYHPHVIIIDGIVDFIESFNDETQSHALVNDILVISDVYHCIIICVLHENKSRDDPNMRGHLGTLLAQKASTVLQCKKGDNGDIIVTCSDSRREAIPEWRIKYDEQGHIVSADGQTFFTIADQRRKALLKIIQESGGSITRKDLTQKLMTSLKLSRTTMANLISKELKDGNLTEVLGMIQPAPELPLDS